LEIDVCREEIGVSSVTVFSPEWVSMFHEFVQLKKKRDGVNVNQSIGKKVVLEK
jgi:hypothetical protein